jgi:glycerol kinase
MKAILAFDQGTTSSRAIAFGRDGRILAVSQQEFRQIFPQPGWVEHDPLEIWATQRDVAAQALAAAGLTAGDVGAIGITNQRETTLLWERASGRPVANAIVWQDRRTAPQCDALRQAGHEALFAHRTGLVLDAYFSGTKLAWLLDNVPGARERASAASSPSARSIRGSPGSSPAARARDRRHQRVAHAALQHPHLDWDDELLALLDIPRAVLPRVVASSGRSASPRATGLPPASPSRASRATSRRRSSARRATARHGEEHLRHRLLPAHEHRRAAAASRNRLLTTVAWQRAGATAYALEGSVFIAGAAIQWLRDGLGIIERSADVEALAASVPDSGDAIFVPALSGLGAPYWDPRARGTLGRHHPRDHARPHRARGAGRHRVPERGADRGHGGRLGNRAHGAARGRRRHGEQPPHADQADLLGVPVVRPR